MKEPLLFSADSADEGLFGAGGSDRSEAATSLFGASPGTTMAGSKLTGIFPLSTSQAGRRLKRRPTLLF